MLLARRAAKLFGGGGGSYTDIRTHRHTYRLTQTLMGPTGEKEDATAAMERVMMT